VEAIQAQIFVLPRIKWLHDELFLRCTHNNLYGSGHAPDGFISLALALEAWRLYRLARCRQPTVNRIILPGLGGQPSLLGFNQTPGGLILPGSRQIGSLY
jgi:hypothetical protein